MVWDGALIKSYLLEHLVIGVVGVNSDYNRLTPVVFSQGEITVKSVNVLSQDACAFFLEVTDEKSLGEKL